MNVPWKSWSLVIKLTALIAGLMLSLVAMATYLSIQREQAAFRQSMEQEAVSILASVNLSSADALYFMDTAQLNNTAALLINANPNILAIDFFGADGHIVASSKNVSDMTFAIDPFGEKVLMMEHAILEWQPDRLIAGKGLIIAGEPFGGTRIELSTDQLNQNLIETRNQGMALAIAIVLIGTIFTIMISNSISGPILKVVQATERVARGDLTQKVPITGGDEIGRLASAFNRMTTELQNTLTRENTIVQATLEAIVLFEANGRIQDSNPAANKMFGLPPNEKNINFITGCFPAPWRERLQEDLTNYPTGSFYTFIGNRIEAQGLRENQPFALEISIVAINSEATTIFVAIASDITERRKNEEQVLQLTQELERRVEQRTAQLAAANEELEAFSYSVSHDLRAPLRAIEGFSIMLLNQLDKDLAGENKTALQRIRQNAARMTSLIDALLSFSRLGRSRLSKRIVDPQAIVTRILDDLDMADPERQIDIIVQDLPSCVADETLLEQVFANLLGNAFKYTQQEQAPNIEIGATHAEKEIIYFVRDNGVGFDMKYVDKLFTVFTRLHHDDQFEGLGIGLANVKKILQRHNGRIWVESQPNEGTTFYFALPDLKTKKS